MTTTRALAVALAAGVALHAADASADAFDEYGLQPDRAFSLPAGAGSLQVLADGRIAAVRSNDTDGVYELLFEDSVGSRTFSEVASFSDTLVASFGPSFISLSPDGQTLAVGDNQFNAGNSVLFFDAATFSPTVPSTPFANAVVPNFDAAWLDNDTVAVAGADSSSFVPQVALVDLATVTPDVDVVVTSIGNGSGGLAFDGAGNLYTGIGFSFSNQAGELRRFEPADIANAASTATPLSFSTGTLIADVLSAASLGFDNEGNLHVGGADTFGVPGDADYWGLIDADAIASPPASGSSIRQFDPDPGADSSYSLVFNPVLEEFYVTGGGGVAVFAVPEPATSALLALGLAGVLRRSRR
ncbi:MAG: PEP-CTERM sorting domain-containing protein [Planctomycetota bacterium]